jgi:predicted nucleotidyltransferase
MGSIEALTRAVATNADLVLVVVFGSAAACRDRPASDLDVGVTMHAGATPDLARLSVDLERATGRTIDLVSLDSAPPLLRMEVARTGRVVLEREPHAWASFRAHAMIDWWDWAPTARQMHQTAARRVRQEAGDGPS